MLLFCYEPEVIKNTIATKQQIATHAEPEEQASDCADLKSEDAFFNWVPSQYPV